MKVFPLWLLFALFPFSLWATTHQIVNVVKMWKSQTPRIEYVNSASTPTDPGTNVTNPTVVTPPSMTAGDLVILVATSRTANPTISATGGQTWTSETGVTATSVYGRTFWCEFNGTWAASPSVTTGTTNGTVAMHVFSPASGANSWAVDVAQTTAGFSAPTTPFTVTVPGITTLTAGALVFASWFTADDNTWGNSTWDVPGMAQYRNTSGNPDSSITSAYKIMTTAEPSGNVSKNQTALGGDAGVWTIMAFKEI